MRRELHFCCRCCCCFSAFSWLFFVSFFFDQMRIKNRRVLVSNTARTKFLFLIRSINKRKKKKDQRLREKKNRIRNGMVRYTMEKTNNEKLNTNRGLTWLIDDCRKRLLKRTKNSSSSSFSNAEHRTPLLFFIFSISLRDNIKLIKLKKRIDVKYRRK